MFKLIGPVRIKQDLVEAKSNVSKRLEFIQNETCVLPPPPVHPPLAPRLTVPPRSRSSRLAGIGWIRW